MTGNKKRDLNRDDLLYQAIPKKFSRRQFISLAGTLTAGTILANCSQTAAPQAPVQEAGQATSAAPPQPEAVKLTAWLTDRRSINEMTEKEAIPDFQSKNPGVTAELQFVPESEIQQKLLTSHAAGNAPDVSSIDEAFLNTLIKEKVLLPIPQDIIDVEKEMGKLTASLYAIPQGDPNAQYYSLPNGVFSGQIYYNIGLLEELGYKPEDIPDTWDDFIKWAVDVTVWNGDTLERGGMALYANEYSFYEDLRYQMAGPIEGNYYPSQSSIAHADEVGTKAWQFIMDLYDVHRLDSREEGLNSRERFGAGRAVTLYNWSWFNGLMDTQYTDINWGLRIPPTFSGEPVYGRRGPDVGFAVASQNEANLEASWALYRYLVSPAYQAKYGKLRGVQPSLREMWEDAAFSAESGPHWGAVAVKNRPENSVDPGFWPVELGDINNRIVPAVRDEGQDIATVLQEVEKAGNEFLKANPQWSILSREQYEANPDWLTASG